MQSIKTSCKKTTGYDPVIFVEPFLQTILPRNAIIKSIRFSGFNSREFEVQSRPKGIITIKYRSNLDTDDSLIKIFVKRLRASVIDAFDVHSRIYALIGDGTLNGRIPRPICYDSNKNVIYTSYTTGKLLTRHLALILSIGNRGKIEASENLLFDIGKWLREYHENMTDGDSERIIDIINETAIEIETGKEIDLPEKNNIIKRLSEYQTKISIDQIIPLTLTHKDFCLRNVLIQESGKFSIIDWDSATHPVFSRWGLGWEDYALFMCNLESFVRFGRIFDENKIQILSRAFRAGYTGQGEEERSEMERFLIWLAVLRHWIGLVGTRKLSKMYSGRIDRRYKQKLHDRLLMGYGSLYL